MTNFDYTKVPTQKITGDNGVTYAYRDLGEAVGIPLIALTHLSANLDNWDPEVIDGLAKHQRVITFDYQGVGTSTGKVPSSIQGMAKDAWQFIETLKLTKVNLLGFSMGDFGGNWSTRWRRYRKCYSDFRSRFSSGIIHLQRY